MPIEFDIVKYLKDGTVLLRCECQATFMRTGKAVAAARRNGVPLKCSACDPTSQAVLNRARLNGVRHTRSIQPQTAKSRECVRLMRDGVNYIDAAGRTDMKSQSAEKLWLRWIVYPEYVRLKTENEQLRARLVAAGAA